MTAAAPPIPKSRAQARRPALAMAGVLSFLIHGGVLAAAHWAWENVRPVRLPPMVAIPVIDAAALKVQAKQEPTAAPAAPVTAEAPPPVPLETPAPKPRVAAARPETKPQPTPARTEQSAAPVRPAWTLDPPLPPKRPAALARASFPPPHQTPPVSAPAAPTASIGAPAAGVNGAKGAAAVPSSKPAVAEASVAGLANPAPDYPWISRQRGEQGRVILDVEVTAKGRARLVHIKRSSGSTRLDRAALKAVKDWRFLPAKRAGRAVAGRIDVPITFRLTD